jgi:hypothetical protein
MNRKSLKVVNEESIEKELINKITKKEAVSDEKEVKQYSKETIEDIENNHFNKNSEEITKIRQIKNKRIDLFNEAFGGYVFCSHELLPLKMTTRISKYLINKEEIINDLTINNTYPDLDMSENFNLRVFKYLDSYKDIYLNTSNLEMRQKLMNIYLFHILNHMFKRKEEIEVNNKLEKIYTRRADKKNNTMSLNAKLKQEFFVDENEEVLQGYSNEVLLGTNEYFSQYHKKINLDNEDYEGLKDQGFTTPRILILLPYKKHAKLIIDELVNILRDGNWKGINNKKKFKEEFNEVDALNDCFRIGLSFDFFENKLKLYQPFEESDIIIASPLGLKLADKVYDFLSSIEILLIDFSEVFIFQNIDHVEEILSFINRPPKNNQNIVSINRIKDNVKDNNLSYLRQNIIVSHFKSLEIELLVKKYCSNIEGIYTLNEPLTNVLNEINDDKKNLYKFEFKMLKVPNDSEFFDYKFNYFTKNVNTINHSFGKIYMIHLNGIP